jgi:hypothetical protein
LIEAAQLLGEGLGLSVWCCDQAGPFQAAPYPGTGWQPHGRPARPPHEHLRNGTAQVLTLLRPADGRVRVGGVTACPNAVRPAWLKRELSATLAELPAAPPPAGAAGARAAWERWQQGLTVKPTPPAELPPLRVLLVLDNRAGHKTAEFVCRLLAQGVMPLYTPWGGSWLNMAESTRRILRRRALGGQHPSHTGQIVSWFAAAAGHWDEAPTPFEWGGQRAARRQRQHERRDRLGGPGAYTRRPTREKRSARNGHGQSK